MIVAAKDHMQRRCVDDEDGQGGTSDDTEEVVLVGDDLATEWEGEPGFYGEYVETLEDEDRNVNCGTRRQLKIDKPPESD